MKTWELGDKGEKTELDKLVEDFTAGADVDYDQRLARYDIFGSIAHVYALEQLELVNSDEARKLRNELRNLLDEDLNLVPGDEDIHTRVENELTDRLGKTGEKLHTARSRNDQVLVDVRLFTKAELFKLIRKLLNLVESLMYFASSHSTTPMVGYTHYRKAMPSSVGLWSGSFAESLLDDLDVIESSFDLIDQSPLGVGAGYGLPVKLDRQLTTDLLGFGKVQKNAIYVMNSRGKFELNLIAALANVQLDLSRLSADLIAFSDTNFNYFDIPEEFTTGSSIMPQKKNPDVLELIRGRSAKFSGYLSSLFSLLHGLRSGYSRDLQETKEALIEGLDTTSDSLGVLAPLISGLKVNQQELLESFTGEVFATDYVFELVEDGLPFREAYRRVKDDLGSEGGSVSEEEIGQSLAKRNHLGGPGNLQLEAIKESLEKKKEEWANREVGFVDCLKKLKTMEEPTKENFQDDTDSGSHE